MPAPRFKTVRYKDPPTESPKSSSASKTSTRSFRSISPTLKQQLLEGSCPITPVSPGALAEVLDRLDGVSMRSTKWHSPDEGSTPESESRHRLTIRRPTKSPSRVVLKNSRPPHAPTRPPSRAALRAEDDLPLPSRPKSPNFVRSRAPFRTPITSSTTSSQSNSTSKFKRHTLAAGKKSSERSSFLDYSKFKDGPRTTRPHSTRVTKRPSILDTESSVLQDLETRIREDLRRPRSPEPPTTPTKLDPSIVAYGTRSCKKDTPKKPKHNQYRYSLETLTRFRENVMKRSEILKKAESMSPIELPAPVISPMSTVGSPLMLRTSDTATSEAKHADSNESYAQSVTRDHSPIGCTPSRASRPTAQANAASRSTSKLNPLAMEFTTSKYQPPAKRPGAQTEQKFVQIPLNVPKQRQSQTKSQTSQDHGPALPQVKTAILPTHDGRPKLTLEIPVTDSSVPIGVGGITEPSPTLVPDTSATASQSQSAYTYSPADAPQYNVPYTVPGAPAGSQQNYQEPMAVPPNFCNVPFQNSFMHPMSAAPPVFIGPVSIPSALQVAYTEGRLPVYMNNALPPQQPMTTPWPEYDYNFNPMGVAAPAGVYNQQQKIYSQPPTNVALNHSARVANAMGPQVAMPLLERFMRRFPNTGKPGEAPARVPGPVPAPTPAPAPAHVHANVVHPTKSKRPATPLTTREAALLQQRLEFLLMQQKEKRAFDALQDQISDLDACGVSYPQGGRGWMG
ncbi:hypothetical protein PVAG01_00619 [Phlyctema vagabunda]|uniref:Uncharacterized protein n=1 Tax=Phlyctema vagabunda TaxID=108571 RepID=A0ABR4PUT3_9HELO